MHLFRRPAYEPVPIDEERDDASQSKELSTRLARPGALKGITIRWTHVVLIAYLIPLCGLLWSLNEIKRLSSLHHSLEKVSIYSPAFDAVEYHDMDLPNAFDSKSIYRGPPTREREEAWLNLWNQAEVAVPEREMKSLNRSESLLEQYVRVPEDEGSGFVAGLEVFHQLHCLNYVRQFTWYLMDKYDNETMPADFRSTPLRNLRMHADHCIETLRLTLMCHSDVTPVLLKWDTYYDPPRASPDFNSHHRCRNFDKILEWNVENGLEKFGEHGHAGGHHH